ncbi:hypothetical protein [Streptomyces sp. NPDC056308]|uniref:hypothetical protein n=1 Tax=Streptomyces sp. NPDC056308 TaxID=3345780 RepID=UPI0035DDF762
MEQGVDGLAVQFTVEVEGSSQETADLLGRKVEAQAGGQADLPEESWDAVRFPLDVPVEELHHIGPDVSERNLASLLPGVLDVYGEAADDSLDQCRVQC